MQKIGTMQPVGFLCAELLAIDASKEVHDLVELLPALPTSEAKTEKKGGRAPVTTRAALEACVVVFRGGVDRLLGEGATAKLGAEILAQPFDKKAKMRGRVVNKRARWNNVFGDTAQSPDYESGKGTVVPFDRVPHMRAFREALPKWFGAKAKQLVAETNVYYDVKKCGIGFHGDAERRIVVCARFGAAMPLVFQWYHRGKTVGAPLRILLADGDMYAMSDKATGHDWRSSSQYTLRHAAGAAPFLKSK